MPKFNFSLLSVMVAVIAVIAWMVYSNIPHKISDKYLFEYQTVIPQTNCLKGDLGHVIENADRTREKALRRYQISTSEQQEFAAEIHKEVLKEFKVIENGLMVKRVSEVVGKMKPFADQSFAYKARIVDADMVNAFTIVGGNIYVTTGLLNFVENDDELAMVLGHEMGHNENGHTLETFQKMKYWKDQFSWLPIGDELLAQVGQVLESILTTSFGQADELESDLCGAYLAYKAGFDPEKGKLVFERFGEMEGSQGQSFLGSISRTHPYSATRYNCISNYLDDARENALNAPPTYVTWKDFYAEYKMVISSFSIGMLLLSILFGYKGALGLANEQSAAPTNDYGSSKTKRKFSIMSILSILLWASLSGIYGCGSLKLPSFSSAESKGNSKEANYSYVNRSGRINTKSDNLNVRATPSKNGKIITSLASGTEVHCVDCCCKEEVEGKKGTWCKIEFDYKGKKEVGYIWGWMLSLE